MSDDLSQKQPWRVGFGHPPTWGRLADICTAAGAKAPPSTRVIVIVDTDTFEALDDEMSNLGRMVDESLMREGYENRILDFPLCNRIAVLRRSDANPELVK